MPTRSLHPIPAWSLRGRDGGVATALDARLPRLLRAIAARGTLVAAARDTGLAYRTAWALLEEAASALEAPLAELTRGRGATLTALGSRLVEADDAASAALAAHVAPLAVPRTTGSPRETAPAPLRVAASHDIALAQLRDRWRLAHGIRLEFRGSVESLAAYASAAVDVAGFHVTFRRGRGDPLLAMLNPERDALVRFLLRAQGIILPRGNPRRVRALEDVAAKGLAIVNRQPGSGTRILFDRLLDDAGLDGTRLAGYTNEEFTHAAVAATVAAGKADAGFGIEAAAAQFGLAFVPLASERYLFAVRQRELQTPRCTAFRELLASAATRKVVAPLPGYAPDAPGQVLAAARWRGRNKV